MSEGRPAVFLDRDGTIIVDRGYVSKPSQVVLMPGAGEGIRRLNEAGLAVIVVSNQSGIGRGLYTERDFDAVQQRMTELLGAESARIDATYFCPHAPDAEPRCECRKPGTELFRRAATEHGIDLARSWYVGDRWRDVSVVESLGGNGILVPTDVTDAADLVRAERNVKVSTTLRAAIDRILSQPR